ncbi:3-phosphoshikimate 1-carboxyvinyltransferase [Rhodocytophaga aerolata]|uniref:3-phosphoshikimate 1-carboxyvinyltransferase n=1 Tax=Rhodocytophaga aerolata TaxID=455078 RepID=A0ABT8RDA8_9BACT|nr:3-phosphoshikimate 1-carboxyvinyltransferase [Rhodocytophaga aerolata]MDO1450082.1 3-phosphoshikimate 1-carboxyvinyltransferase [Rhodocytophaga aerolata]
MSDIQSLLLHKPSGNIQTSVLLPASKSESNRALIIDALTNHQCTLQNLSEARDTQTMQRLLHSQEQTLDVIDAGTTMRFLTAYVAITNKNKILTGTARMCERPISILVDALRSLGANISYLAKEGFPPIHIKSLVYNGVNELAIRGDVSSQYISALLMIAPALPGGLKLKLTGHVGSKPYIQMTLKQMEHFGIHSQWNDNIISISSQTYKPATFWVESDWSAASYWYSIVALAEDAAIELRGLKPHSLQGDSAIAGIMEPLGVQSTFVEGGVRLTKTATVEKTSVDFTHCPDLAQTVAVICAAKNIHLTLTGIESLKIKETDRVKALQQELSKFGATLQETGKEVYEVTRIADWQPTAQPVTVETYDDHRMAMAFAPLALLQDVQIMHPQVVVKSYPRFWQDLKQAGFTITEN